MYDDFQLVKGRRKKKLSKSIEVSHDLYNLTESNLHRKLVKVVVAFKSTTFCSDFLSAVEEALKLTNRDKIEEIICYGLGNFSENKSSLHQLAALLTIQERYNPRINLFDPVFKEIEINILKNFQINVLTENEEGKRLITDQNSTLLFLPHCPKQLTNNFLWANWNVTLSNCILIGNSFSKTIADNSRKVIEDSANYIYLINQKTKEIPLTDNYTFSNIFNDLSVHCFADVNEEFFTGQPKTEPFYLEDIEFIRKLNS